MKHYTQGRKPQIDTEKLLYNLAVERVERMIRKHGLRRSYMRQWYRDELAAIKKAIESRSKRRF